MKTLTLLLTMAVALVLLSSPSAARHDAEDDTGDAKTTRPAKHRKEPTTRKKTLLRGMHARMAKVCKMSEQQQEQVAELNTLRRKAVAEFRADNAEKTKALKAEIAEAGKNKDERALKEARVQLRSLYRKQKEIYTQWQSKIMDVLTPEQKSQWGQYQIMLSIRKRFRNAKLTDDQTARIKTACAKFTAGVDLSDKKARREAIKKLDKHIRKEILTDAQREATTRPARKGMARPKDPVKSSKVEKIKAGKVVYDK